MASVGETEVVEVSLPNGQLALVQARRVDGGGATKTGLGRLDLDGVTQVLEGVTEAVRAGLAKAAPSKVSVELGVELAVKSGKLLGMIVDGESKGSLTITLEWDRSAGSPG
jgi:Trypsin-co-occurring domain 1